MIIFACMDINQYRVFGIKRPFFSWQYLWWLTSWLWHYIVFNQFWYRVCWTQRNNGRPMQIQSQKSGHRSFKKCRRWTMHARRWVLPVRCRWYEVVGSFYFYDPWNTPRERGPIPGVIKSVGRSCGIMMGYYMFGIKTNDQNSIILIWLFSKV